MYDEKQYKKGLQKCEILLENYPEHAGKLQIFPYRKDGVFKEKGDL